MKLRLFITSLKVNMYNNGLIDVEVGYERTVDYPFAVYDKVLDRYRYNLVNRFFTFHARN